MNIINKIKSFIALHDKNKSEQEDNVPEISMSEREDKIYDVEKLSLQKLYEKWSCKDEWLLYDEGMPLLFGMNPDVREAEDSEISERIEDLWVHAQECVHKKLLSVINTEKQEKEWQVRPIDLYSWATVSRITVPDEFCTLMTFVAQTIKPVESLPHSIQTESEEDMLYQKHREIVLGAATSLLVNAPGLCKNNKGNVDSNKIAINIIENEDQWFGDDRPQLAQTAMSDLINEYLKLTRPMV